MTSNRSPKTETTQPVARIGQPASNERRHQVKAREIADIIENSMKDKNLDALSAVWADDIVFHSPVTAVAFQGKPALHELMSTVLDGFETWERTFVIADADECVFGARGRIGGRDVELTEQLRLNDLGQVAEIRITGRPLAGVAAIAAVAAPQLAAHRSRIRGWVAAIMSSGLPAALDSGDRLITRLAR